MHIMRKVGFGIFLTLCCGRAQNISDIPECAVSVIWTFVVICRTRMSQQTQAALSILTSTGCQVTAISCICKDRSFINSPLPVVQKACSPADLQRSSETWHRIMIFIMILTFTADSRLRRDFLSDDFGCNSVQPRRRICNLYNDLAGCHIKKQ